MFSNGTEAMSWMAHNCEHCWKYNPEAEIEKSRCKTEVSISMGFIGGEISKRVDKITEMRDCPYRQEKRQVKKHDGSMPLFEGEV